MAGRGQGNRTEPLSVDPEFDVVGRVVSESKGKLKWVPADADPSDEVGPKKDDQKSDENA